MSKQRNGKRAIALAVGATLALSLAACSSGDGGDGGSGADEQITLRMSWWGSDDRHDRTNKALDLFEKEHKNIKVVRDFGGFDGYVDKISTQYAGKNSPDVIQLYNEILVEFAARGQLYDLSKAVDAGTISLDGWPDTLIDTMKVDGKLAALPFGLSTQGFIFNKKMSDSLGVTIPSEGYTWDDLADYAAAIRKASGGKKAGVTDLSTGYQVFEIWAKQKGQEFLDADGIGFDKQTLIDFWNYWKDLRKSGGATTPDVSTEYLATPYDAVAKGAAASTFLFVNQFDAAQQETPDPLDLTRFPGEATSPGQYLRTAMNLVISSQTKHPKEAAELVNFLLNNKEANKILGSERGVPGNADMVDVATADANDNAKKALGIITSVRENGAPAPVPAPVGSGTVNTMFADIGQKVQFGKMSVKDGADQFFKQAKAELAKEKKQLG